MNRDLMLYGKHIKHFFQAKYVKKQQTNKLQYKI